MAVTRGIAWKDSKRDRSSLAYTRASVLANLEADLAALKAAGALVNLRRVKVHADHVNVWLGRGAYEAETIQIDSVDLQSVLKDMQEVAEAIAAGAYDNTISPMHERIKAQMSGAQAARAVVADWLKTLPQELRDEYETIKGGLKRAEWRKAKGLG